MKLALLGLPLALVACSTLEGDKVDYKAAVKATPLSVPPDLTQLPKDNRYATPGTTVSATGFQAAGQESAQNAVASTFPGLRVEGQGPQRWLVVDQPPEKLWPVIKAFWEETGFKLPLEDAQLGIMETDWNENRGKLPQDFIRRTVGKYLDNLYSTGELDKYRTRVERSATGGTEIYISHRGLVETFKDDQRIKTTWQPRPAEPDLEYEMLRRLMVKIGAPAAQASAALTNASVRQPTARLDSRDGQPVVLVNESFDRAWRRVGLTLDRTGFTVEDRDRSQGTYYVRYVELTPPGQEEPGFFARLFSSEPKDKTPQKYRITVRGQGDSSTVSVLNADGAPEASENAQRILKVIADDLR
jgi:outer membrane protein assembly factor BamC